MSNFAFLGVHANFILPLAGRSACGISARPAILIPLPNLRIREIGAICGQNRSSGS
jgi:hypothetical protein